MKSENIRNSIRRFEAIFEIVLLAIVFYVWWRHGYRIEMFGHRGKYVLMGMYVILTTITFVMCDSLEFGHLKFMDVTVSQVIAMLMVNFITYLELCLIRTSILSFIPIIEIMVTDVIVSIICCYFFTYIYHHFYAPKNMVMICGSPEALKLRKKMDKGADEYKITKVVFESEGLDAIKEAINTHDAVVINDVSSNYRNDILKYSYEAGVKSYVVPKISDLLMRGATPLSVFDTPLLLIKDGELTPIQAFLKRCMDLFIGIICLIPASLIMLVVAMAIKIEDQGPVFYTQKRVTLGDREFGMLKFRSMIPDAEKYTGAVLASENDPRITKVGRVIRAMRLDEVPQLLNILKGDMSFVGPRPERRALIIENMKEMPEFAYRTRVKGGLTGYAQVYGKYNTTPFDKLKLDLMYIENYSLILDIKLFLMTPQIMFRKESTEGVESREEG